MGDIADLVPGNRFRLYRESDTSPGTYEFLCLGTTIAFNRTSEFEDATAPNCTDPLAVPWRKSSRKSRAWALNFSGRVDAKRFEKIEADEASESPKNYQIKTDQTAALGGKTYTGPVMFETLEMGKNDNGFVTFSAQARGQGAYTTAAVA